MKRVVVVSRATNDIVKGLCEDWVKIVLNMRRCAFQGYSPADRRQSNVGRPPQITPGSLQHAVIAINVDTLFLAPGGYLIAATIDGGVDKATWPFQVHDTHAAS